jgi:prevent-host-death family protein
MLMPAGDACSVPVTESSVRQATPAADAIDQIYRPIYCPYMDKIPISKFKTNCTAIVDQVATTGQPVTITRHGKAVAEVVPSRVASTGKRILGGMAGTLDFGDDIIHSEGLWDTQETVREWDELNAEAEARKRRKNKKGLKP